MNECEIKLSALVVDDVQTPREIISKMLNAMGVSVVFQASNGKDALDILAKEEISLVISDWNMHPMDGLQLLQEMRNQETHKKTPFIMVTATAEKDEVIKACTSGVTGYIIKPFNLKVLQDAVAKFVKLPSFEDTGKV